MDNFRPDRIFATIATADRSDAGVGVVWFAYTPRGRYLLTVLDYDLSAMSKVSGHWIRALFERGAELAKERRAIEPECVVWCEPGGLLDLMRAACRTWLNSAASRTLPIATYDFCVVPATKIAEWPPTIDARAELIRPLVNSGTLVKFESTLRKFGFRALRLNHVASQLRAHQPGVPGTAGELVHALTLGILLARDGDARTNLPDFPDTESHEEGPLARVAAMFRRAIPAMIVPRITEKHRQQAKRIAWEKEFAYRAALISSARDEPGWRALSRMAVSMPPAPPLPGQQLSTSEDDPPPDPPPETGAFVRLVEQELTAYAASREQFIAQLNRLYPGRLPS